MRNLHQKILSIISEFDACQNGERAFRRLIRAHPNASLKYIYNHLPIEYLFWFIDNISPFPVLFEYKLALQENLGAVHVNPYNLDITYNWSDESKKINKKKDLAILRSTFEEYFPFEYVREMTIKYLSEWSAHA